VTGVGTQTGTVNYAQGRNEESCKGDDIGNFESELKSFSGQIEFHNLLAAAAAAAAPAAAAACRR